MRSQREIEEHINDVSCDLRKAEHASLDVQQEVFNVVSKTLAATAKDSFEITLSPELRSKVEEAVFEIDCCRAQLKVLKNELASLFEQKAREIRNDVNNL